MFSPAKVASPNASPSFAVLNRDGACPAVGPGRWLVNATTGAPANPRSRRPRTGRPPRRERKACHKVTIRLTDSEYRHLRQEATKSEHTMSALVRARLAGRVIKAKQPPIPEINRQAYCQLVRVGNNLNQIAKRLNSGLYAQELKTALDDVREAVRVVGLGIYGGEE